MMQWEGQIGLLVVSQKKGDPKIIQKRSFMVIQYGKPCFWGTPILRNAQLARGNCVDYFAILHRD